MSDKQWRVEATSTIVNEITFWIKAKNREEAIDKAKMWDYEEIDESNCNIDEPELEIVEVCEELLEEVEK